MSESQILSQDDHFRALEAMYQVAPINGFFPPKMDVSEGHAVITIEVTEQMFHSAGAAHGSVYFKLLDDAAFFAANSFEHEVFVLTTSFTTYLTKPVGVGELRAEGRVVNKNNTQWIAEAVVYNHKGQEVGRGSGVFVRSKQLLAQTPGYQDYMASLG